MCPGRLRARALGNRSEELVAERGRVTTSLLEIGRPHVDECGEQAAQVDRSSGLRRVTEFGRSRQHRIQCRETFSIR